LYAPDAQFGSICAGRLRQFTHLEAKIIASQTAHVSLRAPIAASMNASGMREIAKNDLPRFWPIFAGHQPDRV
jgi:hypothetical protein